MPVVGQDIVAKNIIKFGGGFLKSVNKIMKESRVILDTEITSNISLTDHSLTDLAKLDHPYAKRHGSSGKNLHNPNWQIHKQSGNLLNDAKSSGTQEASISSGTLVARAYVRIDTSKASYANALIYGTSKMIPRPFLTASRDRVAPDIKNHITKTLKGLKVDIQ